MHAHDVTVKSSCACARVYKRLKVHFKVTFNSSLVPRPVGPGRGLGTRLRLTAAILSSSVVNVTLDHGCNKYCDLIGQEEVSISHINS